MLAGTLLLGGSLQADRVLNPHAFLSEEGSCPTCHSQVPVTSDAPLVKDVVSLCTGCHLSRGSDVHPVDLRARPSDRLTLPLDKEQMITCLTCHDPHMEAHSETPYIRQGTLDFFRSRLLSHRYRTFFLRIPNDEGQICLQCHTMAELTREELTPHESAGDYRGSGSCLPCHGEVYDQWSLTLHARTLGDPATEDGVVLARFAGEETFEPSSIYRTVGSHWTQRYVLQREGGAQVARDVWSVADDKWARTYWREQGWRELCAGCHYTAYNPYLDAYVEEGIGCEACHGPGGGHADSGGASPILNPGKLSRDERETICASCHTLGHDRTGEFRYPVGYVPGKDLALYYRGLVPKKGQGKDTFFDDGTVSDRLRSLRFWTDRYLARKGVNCTLCRSFRSGGEDASAQVQADPDPDMSLSEHCLSCHGVLLEPGNGHLSVDRETPCHRCHAPLADSRGLPSIHDHKFVFGKKARDQESGSKKEK